MLHFCKICSSSSSLLFTKFIQRPGLIKPINSLLFPIQQPFIGNRTMANLNFLKGRRQSFASTSSTPHRHSGRHRRWRQSTKVALFGVAAFFVYALNLMPDRRELFDPKHYYTNIWIRIQTSQLATFVSPRSAFFFNLPIPPALREPLYGAYVKFYGCRMDEAAEESLRAYPTFSAFFNRPLKEGTRPISSSLLVSPADGTVIHYGKVEGGWIEYVKDKDYEVHEFLGPINVDTKEGHSLFHIVIYLAPGDYHAFHSPTKWRVFEKIHFPGFFQSVKPANLLRNPKLLTQNERMVLSGKWKFGYFSMTAVAAFIVGDIVILNQEPVRNRKLHETEQFSIYDEKMGFKAGDKVGEFRAGSTVVLIFEAPSDIKFCIQAGDKLRYGQSLLLQPSTF